MNNKIQFAENISPRSAEKKLTKYYKNVNFPTIPMNEWGEEQRKNKALYKLTINPETNGWAFLSKTHPKLEAFVDKFAEYSYVKSIFAGLANILKLEEFGVDRKAESKEKCMCKRYCVTGIVYTIDCGKAKVKLTTYNDGIELMQVKVLPEYRNQGIGTQIVNDLYDISEEMNVELYLMPYPDDDFEGGWREEERLINRLEAFYTKLGFGKVPNTKMWSNMELA